MGGYRVDAMCRRGVIWRPRLYGSGGGVLDSEHQCSVLHKYELELTTWTSELQQFGVSLLSLPNTFPRKEIKCSLVSWGKLGHWNLEVVSVCLAASKAGKCDGRANGRGTKANRLSFPDSGDGSRGRDIFGRNSRGERCMAVRNCKKKMRPTYQDWLIQILQRSLKTNQQSASDWQHLDMGNGRFYIWSSE